MRGARPGHRRWLDHGRLRARRRGWFWYIPLPDDIVSVGVVAERDYLLGEGSFNDLAAIFAREG